MVEVDAIWDGGPPPALTDAERREAEEALAIYRQHPRGSSDAKIAKMVGTAALGYPAAKLSGDEADGRLRLYQSELADIDADILGPAFSAAVRGSKFFPTIAELRDHAARVPRPRRYLIAYRLRKLLEHRPQPAIAEQDLVRPEQMRELISRLGRSLAA